MLGLKKALSEFKKFPNDPYVTLEKVHIEIRFNNVGEIVAAYDGRQDIEGLTWVERRWHSAEFEGRIGLFER